MEVRRNRTGERTRDRTEESCTKRLKDNLSVEDSCLIPIPETIIMMREKSEIRLKII